MAERKKGQVSPEGLSEVPPMKECRDTFARKEAKRRRLQQKSGERREEFSEAASSFTLSKAVGRLVSAASQFAAAEQGSSGVAASDSQPFHVALHQCVQQFFSGSNSDLRVQDLAGLVCSILDFIKSDDQCRPLPTTGSSGMFPLPVSRCSELFPSHPELLQCLCQALNSLSGVDDGPATRGTTSSVGAMKRLAGILEQSVIVEEPLPHLNYDTLFSHKKVDYQGDEGFFWRSL